MSVFFLCLSVVLCNELGSSVLCQAFLPSASPALFSLQQTPVSGDLPLQFHLGIQELVVALALGGQSHPHLLQLCLQPSDHLREVLQSA